MNYTELNLGEYVIPLLACEAKYCMYLYFKTKVFHLVFICDIFRSEVMCAISVPLLLTGHDSAAVTLTPTCALRSWDFWLQCSSSSSFVPLSVQFIFLPAAPTVC